MMTSFMLALSAQAMMPRCYPDGSRVVRHGRRRLERQEHRPRLPDRSGKNARGIRRGRPGVSAPSARSYYQKPILLRADGARFLAEILKWSADEKIVFGKDFDKGTRKYQGCKFQFYQEWLSKSNVSQLLEAIDTIVPKGLKSRILPLAVGEYLKKNRWRSIRDVFAEPPDESDDRFSRVTHGWVELTIDIYRPNGLTSESFEKQNESVPILCHQYFEYYGLKEYKLDDVSQAQFEGVVTIKFMVNRIC